MKSCDTNILLYALNPNCPEHKAARSYIDPIKSDVDFVISEVILLELYMLLRNSKVMLKPYSSQEAAKVCGKLRTNPYWKLVDYQGGLMDKVWQLAQTKERKPHYLYDARLALSLRDHGVQEFATRNVSDFKTFNFFKVINPID